MTLNDLLAGIIELDSGQLSACDITGIAHDSRQVKDGDVFLAYPGCTVDGRDYITEALERGAQAIICETQSHDADHVVSAPAHSTIIASCEEAQIPFIECDRLAHRVSALAGRFYGDPSSHLKVIGVTGTNGKTSVVTWIAQALGFCEVRCAVIGTLGCGSVDRLELSSHTTPDAIFVQKKLAEFYRQGIEVVAMEVSSHALDQGRVDGVQFEVAVLTQLSREHLDYHGDMASYRRAKQKLFDLPAVRQMVLNLADDLGQAIYKKYSERRSQIYSYTTDAGLVSQLEEEGFPAIKREHLLQAVLRSEKEATLQATFSWADQDIAVRTQLLGDFNVDNLLAVVGALMAVGVAWDAAIETLAALSPVLGRMQCFGGAQTPQVIVDYAHTPDGLAAVLSSLRSRCQQQLIVVFGCGGERDQGKRPQMAEVACHYADRVILTDDNPRGEDPAAIIKDIVQGMPAAYTAQICHQRREAIATAIACAQPADVVLVAGKGHETDQQVADKRLVMSDQEMVQQALAAYAQSASANQ